MGKQSKRPSGGAALKAAGKKPILCGVTPEQLDELRGAADREGRKVAPFVVFHALAAARKILKKTGEKP
jgi:uncharacterized protein (DUF1778 family)